MLKVVQDAEASNENTASSSLLDEIVRDGVENGVLVERPGESTSGDTHAA